MVIGSIGGGSSIGTRSHLTKIVGRDEIGKVMSFMSALDTLAPMISSTVFTYIFKYTINTYPGAVYLVTAFLILVPIYVMMWIDLYTERPLYEGEGHRKHHQDENQNEEDAKDDEQKSQRKYHRNYHGHHKHSHKHETNGGKDEPNENQVQESNDPANSDVDVNKTATTSL